MLAFMRGQKHPPHEAACGVVDRQPVRFLRTHIIGGKLRLGQAIGCNQWGKLKQAALAPSERHAFESPVIRMRPKRKSGLHSYSPTSR